ncbi:immunity 22 family protein [Pseudomonas syringae]|uniref:immunity 22 family protein n=1 Tax=Pseudomonas syringae TaxID=317 RepID=UPI0018E5BA28|nr:immunity 22 family protein [Pseudomonas syringae]MBI6783150.1 immunity 22 family protein [Pseudomonas syringae]
MSDYDLEKYEKVHLWVGTNFSSESDYKKYFELDYSTEGDFDDPNYKLCDFCKDVNTKWYDEDFIGIIPRRETEVEIDEILNDAAIDQSERVRAETACKSLGILKANAIFWYADADLVVSPSANNSYNGLSYIGIFEGD